MDVDYVEAGVDTSKYYPALVDMCEKGYDLILTISSNNDDALVQVAEEYPDQKFINLMMRWRNRRPMCISWVQKTMR